MGRPIDAPLRNEFIVDTSAVAKFFLTDEDLVSEARRLEQAYRLGRLRLVAGFPLFYELPSTLLRAVRQRRIAANDARVAVQLFLQLPFDTVELSGPVLSQFIARSYDLAEGYSSSYYDALFVATSEFTGIPLVTADGPLFEAYKSDFDVIWLGNLDLP